MRILVFKTSIRKVDEVKRLKPILDGMMHKYEKWNFDLEDCDNILRVEAIYLEPSRVIADLQREGFACAELED